MTKIDDETELLRDGQVLRVPLMMMDSVQRSIYEQSTEAAVRATHDAMRKQARSEASLSRPGYRLNTQLITDSAARDALADAYGEYEDRLINAYKNPAPGPISATADDQQLIDSEFDADPYAAYDRRIRDAWKGD